MYEGDADDVFFCHAARLLGSEGATVVGKANCDEFGMGSLNVYSVHGPVVNPWDIQERRSAGGSSGGSAAAVAAGMCDVALGTDTGGSIRLPASYCGVVGLKPSYGMLSRWGVVSFADSLDCVGILGKNVSSTQRRHSQSMTQKIPQQLAPKLVNERTKLVKKKCTPGHLMPTETSPALESEYFPTAITPSVLSPLRHTLRSLQKRGAELVPVSLPQTQFALSAYYVLASAEASSNLARYDGVRYGLHVPPPPGSPTHASTLTYAHSRTRGFGPEVRKRIILGTYALTADAFDNYFLQAQRVRMLIREDFTRVFRVPDLLAATSRPASLALPSGGVAEESAGVHVLMHPSAIRTAPPLSEGEAKEGGESLDAYVQDVLTVPASLAGVPALSVPVPADEGGDGWPVGVSVVGQWGCEEMVLRVGRAIEEVAL
ncbi:hypothetical protein EVG20_g6233 [Dentipellis fragilis]|uniref:Amidase domain-containing protein n=1 Tax=Dentipellis fragilis TaxID=205917 RepID=A0A4Y9YPP7_9AGAM|nr:hypothetical protein EVG20_g6233 [Dentipellis fragilis]